MLRTEDQARSLLTFERCPDLLRGMRLSGLLRCGGRIFANSSGSASTYEQSEKVLRLRAFISHNWSVPRWKKFLALAFHFNFWMASSAMAGLWLLAGVASALGFLPAIFDRMWQHPTGVLGRLLFGPLYLLNLLIVRDFLRCFGYRGPPIFLDKTCICQDSNQAKQRGIEKLGAFLNKSEVMVVLYTDVYLSKLWTVYEVASFLALKDIDDLKIVPITEAKMFFVLVGMASLMSGLRVLLRARVPRLSDCLMALALPLAMKALRRLARQRKAIISRLETFTVQECTCSVESDRATVYANIATLMRAYRVVPRDASDAAALSAFDDLVRRELPGAFVAALGRWTFQYAHYVMLSMVLFGAHVPDKLRGGLEGIPNRKVISMAANYLGWTTIFGPLAMVWLKRLSRRRLRLEGWREGTFLALAFLFGFLPPGFATYKAWFWAASRAEKSSLALTGKLLAVVAGTCATRRLIDGPLRLGRGQRSGCTATTAAKSGVARGRDACGSAALAVGVLSP